MCGGSEDFTKVTGGRECVYKQTTAVADRRGMTCNVTELPEIVTVPRARELTIAEDGDKSVQDFASMDGKSL